MSSSKLGATSVGNGVTSESALDVLLDELQTFSKPQTVLEVHTDESMSDDGTQTLHNTVTTQHSQSNPIMLSGSNALQTSAGVFCKSLINKGFTAATPRLRHLHSCPSESDTESSPQLPSRPIGKPPVPEKNIELSSKIAVKRVPPPPPPRTSSRSPLASPTSPSVSNRLLLLSGSEQIRNCSGAGGNDSTSENEHFNDQNQRHMALEMRHQELLKKQKVLQEQYSRLQQMSKNSIALPTTDILHLKKTGSESNLLQKMGLNIAKTGSMKNLNSDTYQVDVNQINSALPIDSLLNENSTNERKLATPTISTSKVYETDIL